MTPPCALDSSMHAGAVGDHRAALDADRFAAGQHAAGDGEGGVVAKLDLHSPNLLRHQRSDQRQYEFEHAQLRIADQRLHPSGRGEQPCLFVQLDRATVARRRPQPDEPVAVGAPRFRQAREQPRSGARPPGVRDPPTSR